MSVVKQPLDDAFVRDFRYRIEIQPYLFTEPARTHWTNLFNHFQGRSDFEIRAYIAQNFKSGNWIGNEAWFVDSYTQKLFQRYDRTEFVRSNIPPLDDEARSHYNPSNTVREYLSGHSWPLCLAVVCSFTGSRCVLTLCLSPSSDAATCSLRYL